MKAKSSILTVILSLFLASGLLAQDKYEYAIVEVRGFKIAVATSGEVQTYPYKGDTDVELLKKVEELTQQGWELFNTTTISSNVATTIGSHIFYLRKKKN